MKLWIIVISSIGLIIGLLIASALWTPSIHANVNPIVNKRKKTGNKRVGMASYYSRRGCLGCSKAFTMANGKKLNDHNLTLAYNSGKLNRKVKITNYKTGKIVIATVTDRGGFERHGKIADLSLATKNALRCGDICKVEIAEL